MTERQRREAREAAEYKATEAFRKGVKRVQSWEEAWKFALGGPKSHPYYTNLCFFIRWGYPPFPVANSAEQIAIYDALVARLGKLTPRGGGG